MSKLMKKIYRILIVILSVVTLTTTLMVRVNADGYMYSSDGKLIECSVGFTITSEGIYSVLSDSWKDLKVDNDGDVSKFNSPSDMCLYDDKETGNQILYVVAPTLTSVRPKSRTSLLLTRSWPTRFFLSSVTLR